MLIHDRAFLKDKPLQPSLDRASRLALAGGQKPFAAYVSCSDSRVPPELLFGRGLDELFIVPNAGNTLDVAAMGSPEFAVSVLGVPLIVVMGHEGCGAVSTAMPVVDKGARFPGNIGKMVEPIIPAVVEAARFGHATLEGAVRQNVAHVVRELREDSALTIIGAQTNGGLHVVGAYYALGTGEVDFSIPVLSRVHPISLNTSMRSHARMDRCQRPGRAGQFRGFHDQTEQSVPV